MSSNLLGLLPLAASRGGGLLAGASREAPEAPERDGLQGLLGNPLLGLAAGLLSAAGPSREPISLGQGLASGLQLSSGLRQAQAANEATRQQLSARARQREAREGLIARIDEGGAALDDPDTLGLLARAEPELFGQALIGQVFPAPTQERAEPADIRSLRAVGIDPASPEGREIVLDRLRSQGATDEALRALQLQLTSFGLEEKRRAREQEEDTQAKQRRGLELATRRNLRRVQKLADINQELRGTLFEAGIPFSDLRRDTVAGLNAALEAAGVDRSQQRETVAKFDTFRKDLSDLVIDTIDRFGGNITNQQLALLEEASAGPGVSPQTVASRLADVAEIQLDSARTEGIEIEDEDALREFIAQQRAFASGGEPGPGTAESSGGETESPTPRRRRAPRPAAIRRMSAEQIRRLDRTDLSPEAEDALLARIEELVARER